MRCRCPVQGPGKGRLCARAFVVGAVDADPCSCDCHEEVIHLASASADLFDADAYPKAGAVLSADRRYRYALTRAWQPGKRGIAWIMLNPSTADHEEDDRTIAKITRFSKGWGFDRLAVANLFGYRATDPRELDGVDDPVGQSNDRWLRTVIEGAELVICAWGMRGSMLERDRIVLGILAGAGVDPYVLRLTKRTAKPEHPLYMRGDAKPIRLADANRERFGGREGT